MNLIFPGVEYVFDCGDFSSVNSLIVQNPILLREIIKDVNEQMSGNPGKTVISDNGRVLATDKYLEIHSHFVSFSINQKNLISKIINKLNSIAIAPEHYVESMELVSTIERYCMGLSVEAIGDISFSKLSVENIIKAAGVEIVDDYESLAEKLIDYFELVTEYDKSKIYVLLNLRSFLSKDELQSFIDEVLKRQFQVLLLESNEYPLLENEKRVLIDESLCEIC